MEIDLRFTHTTMIFLDIHRGTATETMRDNSSENTIEITRDNIIEMIIETIKVIIAGIATTKNTMDIIIEIIQMKDLMRESIDM